MEDVRARRFALAAIASLHHELKLTIQRKRRPKKFRFLDVEAEVDDEDDEDEEADDFADGELSGFSDRGLDS